MTNATTPNADPTPLPEINQITPATLPAGLRAGRHDELLDVIGSFEGGEEAGEPVAVQVGAAIRCAGNRRGAFLRERWSRRQQGKSCDE